MGVQGRKCTTACRRRKIRLAEPELGCRCFDYRFGCRSALLQEKAEPAAISAINSRPIDAVSGGAVVFRTRVMPRIISYSLHTSHTQVNCGNEQAVACSACSLSAQLPWFMLGVHYVCRLRSHSDNRYASHPAVCIRRAGFSVRFKNTTKPDISCSVNPNIKLIHIAPPSFM